MSIAIEVISSTSDIHDLRESWNQLVHDNPDDLLGLDATSTFDWFLAILAAFPEASKPVVIVARNDKRIIGMLPILMRQNSWFGPELYAPTELYGGRNGPLLLEPCVETLAAMMKAFDRVYPGWATYRLTLVAKSPGATAIHDACRALGYPIVPEGIPQDSLYFPICKDDETFLKGLGKDLNQRIRSSEKKMANLGLRIQHFGKGDDTDQLINAVLAIEHKSWKHKEGTAITNHPRQEGFYRALFPLALDSGILHAIVLSISTEPVAYVFGISWDGVFCSLKTSMAEEYEKLSPAHLAHHKLLQHLRDRNHLIFDFMGVIDPHKRRWSVNARQYTRQSWLIYNINIRGRIRLWFRQLKSYVRQTWPWKHGQRDCAPS